MFNDIAKTYDTTNRVMSMGIDISWRKEACEEAQILNKQKLDIGGSCLWHRQYDAALGAISLRHRDSKY